MDVALGKTVFPVFKGLVGGDQNRTALVTSIDDFVEQIGCSRVIGKIADFINGE